MLALAVRKCIFTARQQSCWKVMFSIIFCLSVHSVWMSHATITHDALDLIVQGPGSKSHCIVSLLYRHPTSDIWLPKLETSLYSTPLVLTSVHWLLEHIDLWWSSGRYVADATPRVLTKTGTQPSHCIFSILVRVLPHGTARALAKKKPD